MSINFTNRNKSFNSLKDAEKTALMPNLKTGLRNKLISFLPNITDEQRKEIAKLNFDNMGNDTKAIKTFIEKKTIKAFIKEIKPQLRETGVFDDATLDALNKAAPDREKLGDLLGLDKPVQDNPVFSGEINKAKAIKYAEIAGVKTSYFKDFTSSVTHLDLNTFSEEKGIIKKDRHNLTYTQNLLRLSGENYELVAKLKSEQLRANGKVFSKANDLPIAKRLVAFTAKEWQDLGLKNKEAEVLIANFRQNFPTVALMDDIVFKKPNNSLSIEELKSLYRPLGGEHFFEEGDKAKGIEKLQKEVQNTLLKFYDNHFDDLDEGEFGKTVTLKNFDFISDILYDKEKEEIKNALEGRDKSKAIKKLNAKYKAKGETLPNKTQRIVPNWRGLTENKAQTRSMMMAMQRMEQIIPDNPALITKALSKGLNSAMGIDQQTAQEMKRAFGSHEEANILRSRVKSVIEGVGMMVAAGADSQTSTNVSNSKYVRTHFNTLRKLDGFEDLFGSQNYCECEHCKSIFGPAAYFVDLMQFIDFNTRDSFSDGTLGQNIHLKNRRSDLWDLELTCENTTGLIPHIELVNEVLENYIYVNTLSGSADDTISIKESQVYDHLSKIENVKAISQPFNLPLTELRTYLQHFETSLQDVYKIAYKGLNKEVFIAQQALGLSYEDLKVICLRETEEEVTKKRFHTSSIELSGVLPQVLKRIEIQRFLDTLEISREQLDSLIQFHLLSDDGIKDYNVGNLSIRKVRNHDSDINQYVEYLHGVTTPRLERLFRFIKLWKKLEGWTMEHLDLLLQACNTLIRNGFINGSSTILKINDGTMALPTLMPIPFLLREESTRFIVAIYQNNTLCQQLNINIDEAIALIYGIPNPDPEKGGKILQEHEISFFDSLFNHDYNAIADQRLIELGQEIVSPQADLSEVSVEEAATFYALLSGLRIAANDLEHLISYLKINIEGGDVFEINQENLNKLYRYTIIARQLKLSIADFTHIDESLGIQLHQKDYATLFDTIQKLINFKNWQNKIGISIDDLGRIISKETHFNHQLNTQNLYDFVQQIKNEQKHLFTQEALKAAEEFATVDTAIVVEKISPNLITEEPQDSNQYQLNNDWSFNELFDKLSTNLLTNIIPNDTSLIRQIKNLLKAQQELKFNDDLLAEIAGISEIQSKKIIPLLKDAAVLAQEGDSNVFYVKNKDNVSEANIKTLMEEMDTFINNIIPLIQEGIVAESDFKNKFVSPTSTTIISDENYIKLWDALISQNAVISVGGGAFIVLYTKMEEEEVKGILTKEDLGAADNTAYNNKIKKITDVLNTCPFKISNEVFKNIADIKKWTRENDTIKASEYIMQLLLDYLPNKITQIETKKYQITDKITLDDLKNCIRKNEQYINFLWGNLSNYFPTNLIATQIANHLQVKIDAVKTFMQHSDFANLASKLMKADTINESLLEDYQKLEYELFVQQKLKLTPQNYLFAKDNKEKFSITDNELLSMDSLLQIAKFQQLLPDADLNKRAYKQYIKEHPETTPDPEPNNVLALAFNVDLNFLFSIRNNVNLNDSEQLFDDLLKIKKGINLCQKLGINGHSLKLLVSNEYKNLAKGAADIKAAMRSKYEDEEKWKEDFQNYKNKISEQKRNALTNYLLSIPELNFKTTNELFHYFLIDTEMSPCFETSRVKAGISSLQLYVHRCFMNLEQEVNEDNEVIFEVFFGGTDPKEQDRAKQEWEWRKNYRVWEANRKVFLYPENYMEPSLRDNKTPIFKDLEDSLLQRNVSDESIEEAYRNYMEEFIEVANLSIVGNYFDRETSTFYIIGKRGNNFYYRTFIDGDYGSIKEWFPWQKIELAINADFVSPIVYRNKLYLTWVELTEREEINLSSNAIASMAPVINGDFYNIIDSLIENAFIDKERKIYNLINWGYSFSEIDITEENNTSSYNLKEIGSIIIGLRDWSPDRDIALAAIEIKRQIVDKTNLRYYKYFIELHKAKSKANRTFGNLIYTLGLFKSENINKEYLKELCELIEKEIKDNSKDVVKELLSNIFNAETVFRHPDNKLKKYNSKISVTYLKSNKKWASPISLSKPYLKNPVVDIYNEYCTRAFMFVENDILKYFF